jgi:hypothetical protein
MVTIKTNEKLACTRKKVSLQELIRSVEKEFSVRPSEM